MSSTPSTKLGVNNILSFNGHGGKISSGENQTFELPDNVYVLVPFGIGVKDAKGLDGGLKTTDDSFKGLDVCYGFPSPENKGVKPQSFEDIIYGDPGKLKLTFSNDSSNTDATWYLYKPKEQVPNVEYFAWKDGDAAAAAAATCENVKNYDPFVSDLMKECLTGTTSNELNKKVCALFVSDSTKTDTSKEIGSQSEVLTDKDGYRHLKLKICGDPSKPTTTLKELAKNCHDLVNFSREFVKKKQNSGETYKDEGYNDDNIFPKSNTADPIILLPFSCNSCGDGSNNIALNHTNEGDAELEKSLSEIIGELSGGGAVDPVASSDPIVSGKVAQFFMTYSKQKDDVGLDSSQQAQKITNVVKCLIAKGYKHIGLTYSANQDQTIQVFGDYKYDKNLSTNTFENDQEKNISTQILNGSNQAAVLTKLNDIVKDSTSYSNFKKAFRVIPFTTMRYIKATDSGKVTASDLNETDSGNNKECVAVAEEFLKLDDSIILGWCNQDCDGMDDTSSTKQKFAIGGGIAAGLPKAKNTYIPEYLKFLESKWGQEVQKIVDTCSPSPTSVDSPDSPPPPPPKPAPPKIPFTEVLNELVGQLNENGDPSVVLTTLGVNDNFLYPTDGSEANKKSLNSDEPNIKKMIEDFESATDEGDKNFYLGACRSIQAAYQLETEGKDDASAEAMRAKLLLNLRKNSLLLKVPARWDYAEMKMKKLPPPPASLDELMKYSLQDTIEYYAHEGGDEGRRFKELNISEEPTEAQVYGAKVSGVDGRFTEGIKAGVGNSCFFNCFLQYLMCNEDFLQLLIQSYCETNFISSVLKNNIPSCSVNTFNNGKNILINLHEFFKIWRKTTPFSNNTIDNGGTGPIKELYTIFNLNYGGQEDSSEVFNIMMSSLDCLDNIYTKKFLDNISFTEKSYLSTDHSKNPSLPTDYLTTITPKTDIGRVLVLKPPPDFADNLTRDNYELETYKYNEVSINGLIDVFMIDERKKYQINPDELKGDNKDNYDNVKNIINIMSPLNQICINTSKRETNFIAFNTLKGRADINTIFNDSILSIPILNQLKTNLKTIQDFINSSISEFNDVIKFNESKNNIIPNVYTNLINIQKEILEPEGEFQIKKILITDVKKYLLITFNRVSSFINNDGTEVLKKNYMKVKIDPEIKIGANGPKLILQGYYVHSGYATGGHIYFVKCNSKTGKEELVIDDSTIVSIQKSDDTRAARYMTLKNESGSIESTPIQPEDIRQRSVMALIYKKEESNVPEHASSGGFKPRHNTITNHAAPKSKHNSSFKASSSSKSKGKGHSRSHTQRVK